MKISLIVTCFFSLLVNLQAQNQYQSTWESIDSRPVPAWFEDAKFGIFIHWGLYSVPAYSPTKSDSVGVYERYSEHYWRRLTQPVKTQHYFKEFHNRVYGVNFKYQDFANLFKAEMFSPDQWANIIKRSGAKYVVLTSKHHDGFTLWPSQYSWNWNSVDLGPHRDIVDDLTKSVKKQGLKMGVYYSLLEWNNPLYKKETIDKYVNDHMIPQMKELVKNYQPEIFWTDGEWDYSSDVLKSTEFLKWLYNDSPIKETIVVNDRWGKDTRSKHGGFYTTEYELIHNNDTKDLQFSKPWEENRGIGGSFGYNRNEILEDYSTSEELIHLLINKVARGGNLLLNIGPTADGRIPVIMEQRLADIGKWLDINGEAIFGTRKWEDAPVITQETSIYYAKKESDLYVLVTKWQNEPIVIQGIKKAKAVTLLGCMDKIKYSGSGKKLSIIPPVITPSTTPCNYAWVYKLAGVLEK